VTAIDTNSQAAMKYNAWLLSQHLKGQTRSNSWSDDFSFDDYRTSDVNRSLLGESNRFFYDNLKKSYAELLYCYELLPQRAQVLKYLSIPPAPFNNGVEFVTECQTCRKTTRGPSCLHCKKYLLYCSLCQLPVRGAANACLACGHAGHTVSLSSLSELFSHSISSTGSSARVVQQVRYVPGLRLQMPREERKLF
jgi:WD repeat-containing protein 59